MRKLILTLLVFLTGCGQQPVLQSLEVQNVEVVQDIEIMDIGASQPVVKELRITSPHKRYYTIDYDKDPTKRRVRIGNWINYKDSDNVYRHTEVGVTNQPTAPPDWVSQVVTFKDGVYTTTTNPYTFDRASTKSPMQFFARDAMDAGNRAMVGVRLSDDPSLWMNMKAHNIDNAVDVTDIDSQTVQWTNLWTDTNYRVKHGGHFIKVDFILTGENHPASFTETIKLGGGMTLQDNGDNTISVMKDGTEVFKFPQPYGYQESDVLLENPIEVTMTVGEKINGFSSIIVTPSSTQLAEIGYAENIIIDPTATISGTADMDDNMMRSATLDRNYGAGANIVSGRVLAGDTRREIFRVATSAIPNGTITQVTFKVYQSANALTTGSGHTMNFYRILPANVWGEGNKDGTTQGTGESSGQSASHPTAWAGSNLCGTADTDYDSSSMGSFTFDAYTAGADQLITSNLDTTVFENWRDGVYANNGWLWRMTSETTAGEFFNGNSLEHGENEPTVEIDYQVAGNFSQVRRVTIDSTKVASDQTDFAVLLTEADLPDDMLDADGSDPALNGGGDVRATSDITGFNELPVEVVNFVTDNDPANAVAEVWVKVPEVSSTVDTDFFIWWGNPTATLPLPTDPYGSDNVWRSAFKGVWHLQEDPSGSAPQAIDSTANDNDCTSSGGMTSGDLLADAWGKGWDFDGGDDEANCGSASSLNITGDDYTILAWAKTDAWNTNDYIASRFGSALDTEGYGLGLTNEAGSKTLKSFRGGAATTVVYDTSVTIDTTSFHHFVVSHDANNADFYFDSSAGDTPSITTDIVSNAFLFRIGRLGSVGNTFFDGVIGEVKVLNETLTANDILTHYNNENGNFVTITTAQKGGDIIWLD